MVRREEQPWESRATVVLDTRSLAHRIIPTADAQLNRRTTDAIVAEIVHRLPLPHDRSRSPYDTRATGDGRAQFESRGR
jgi:MoxR-like ATPase